MKEEGNGKQQNMSDVPVDYEDISSGRSDIAPSSRDIPIAKRGPASTGQRNVGGRSVQQETYYVDDVPEKKKKKKKKGRKVGAIIFTCVVAVLVCAIAAGVWYVYDLTNDIGYTQNGENDDNATEKQDADFGLYEETLSFSTMYDVTMVNSYNDYLVEWSNNGGEIIHSRNVTNVLLLGEDGDATETQNGRSDCIMLVSINRQTKKIILTSIMRDSYCAYDVQGQTQYGKINEPNFYAGYAGLIKTIESYYKIDIDYYLSVNFNSFPKLVDALGGVNVPIQQYEAEYINETTTAIDKVTYGDSVKIDGDQALVFCRIRHCDTDSDVSRTRRQRSLIKAIIESTKSATTGQLLNAVKQVAPYIKTNMNQSTMIRFGTAALMQKWISYEMSQVTMPDEETRIDATINGQSCWVIDYPKSAQKVQQNIYGITNIVLASDRYSLEELLSMADGGGYYDPYYDEDYEEDYDYYYDDYYW